MQQGLIGTLSLVGTSGAVIIGTIVFVLVLSMGLTFYLLARYQGLARDVAEHTRPDRPFSARVLNHIFEDARTSKLRQGRAANVQAIVEHHFQAELGGLLLGERFIRAAAGLVIILGLVGTFQGLTLSVGKLVSMVTDNPAQGVEVADLITVGLTQALSGMSIAFSTSLFGVGAAIVLTFFSVLFSVVDRRTALMVTIEAHLDRMLAGEEAAGGSPEAERLAHIVQDFGTAVGELENAISQFGAALQTFAGTTRDFREFNLHLKDNVQRMSLSFADVSEAVKSHVHVLREARR